MKRLYILRHAKSSWAIPGLRDHQRSLNKRGRQQLPVVAAYLEEMNYRPDKVYCSTSTRTRETWEGLRDCAPDASVEFSDALYHGSQATYLDVLKSADPAGSVMIIGHNPTCDELARSLTSQGDPAWQSLMDSHYGTAALSVFDIAADTWQALSPESACLIDFKRPKGLQARTEAGQ